ncbi:MAG: sigma-70 family RNA polymerase sigma factor [Vicinamibacterales bacterium]
MLFARRRDPTVDAAGDGFTADALALVDSLYGTALRLTRNAAAAEDLVQDTYLKAFRSRARFEPGTNFRAWIFTILQNTWRNRRRDAARSRVEYDSDAVERAAEGDGGLATPLADSAETLLLRQTLDEDLRRALDSLPEAFRQAVWLRDVEGFSYQEIAATLDVPIGTVMSRIARGRRQLHDRLIAPPVRVPHPVGPQGV